MEDSTGLVTPSAQLYRVLPERETGLQQAALMGSNKLYDVSGITGAARGIEVNLHLGIWFCIYFVLLPLPETNYALYGILV